MKLFGKYNLYNNILLVLKLKPKNETRKGFWKYKSKTQLYIIKNYKDNRFHEIWQQIRPKDLKNKIIYDYGCSNGVWSIEYQKLKANVTGIDYITPHDYKGKKFIQSDITLHKPKQKADLIHVTRVLMHMEHPKQEKAIDNIKNNLKTNGYLLLIEYNKDSGTGVWGRHWKEFLEFKKFKIIKYVSDGILEGILAQKI